MINFKKLNENPRQVVEELTSINRLNLEQELEDASALASDASTELARSRLELARAENKLEQVRARVFNKIQREEDTSIGATERRVDEHEDVVEAAEQVAKKQYKVNIYKSLFFGLKDKKECVVELSRLQRAEMSAY